MRRDELPLQGFHSAIVAAIAGCALIVCTSILARTVTGVKSARRYIRVVGSARKEIRSDFIAWRAVLHEEAPTIPEAYARLKSDREKLVTFLSGKEIPAAEVFPLAIEMKPVVARPNLPANSPPITPVPPEAILADKVIGYQLWQPIEVRSKSVDRVDQAARESTDLVGTGVSLESSPPQYLYRELGKLKLTMLQEAAKDARARADSIAESTGSRVADLHYARMGVLQIVGLWEEEGVTATGANDTTSLDKRVTAIVHAEFGVQ